MAATIAKILFLLALLGQALTAPVGGWRTHASSGDGARLCLVAHADASASSGVGNRAEQAPKSDQSHRHGACAFCELGVGAPPLLASAGWVDALAFRAEDASVHTVFAGVPFSRDDDNAPTRAPPSFS
ncbi:hypothetical protein IY145_11590 [Methylosinus sp. H3A]|uniref:DUF2946 family protein n=1 Tax=Methylosinus sp. H3A TaxID=2785786 RepID=UPI0018C2702A|nr:DUF2946 family protein [Methylosinus sp. H3A]MBG0810021.1 hypothetical protein [Methylosinus sp. H3A]